MSKSKQIGTRGETLVVRYAREHGFPLADRRALKGTSDEGDVLLTAGLIVEVKSGHAAETATDEQLLKWMAELAVERENAGGYDGFLVTKRKGAGELKVGTWRAHFFLGDLAKLRGYDFAVTHDALVTMSLESALVQARAGGYGTPL